MIDRRAFLGTLAGGLLAAPLAAQAQRRQSPPRVAALLDFSPPSPGSSSLIVEALRELGYRDGQNVVFDPRWTDGRSDRLSALADEVVRLSPDVIVTGANESTAAAMRATKTIPIVMVLAVNTVEAGFISSLAHPGGNVTGVTVDVGPEIWAKRLEVLRHMAPTVSRVSVLWSPVWGRPPTYWNEVQRGARKLGMILRSVEIRAPRDVDAALVEGGRIAACSSWEIRSPWRRCARSSMRSTASGSSQYTERATGWRQVGSFPTDRRSRHW